MVRRWLFKLPPDNGLLFWFTPKAWGLGFEVKFDLGTFRLAVGPFALEVRW